MNQYQAKSSSLIGLASSPIQETQRQGLERTKKMFLDKIIDIDRALFLLEKYPEMEELQDLLLRI